MPSWFTTTYPQYLGLNPSHLVFMMVPFWVSLLSLWFLAIKPILHVVEERESRTAGARQEAAELEIRVNEKLAVYEQKMGVAKQKASAELAVARKAIADAEEKILGSARDAAAAEVEKMRQAVEAERVKVRSELKTQAEALARELAEKALGRDLGNTSSGGRPPRPEARS